MLKFKSLMLLMILSIALVSWAVTPASAGTAQVTVRGPTVWGPYTIQFIQNGVVRHQNTSYVLIGGYRTYSATVPDGGGYIANVWLNSVGTQSHTWPTKSVSGTTHLGCLQFNVGGEPEPWSGSCP